MKKVILPTLLFLTSITVLAQTRPHIVDKAHSQINFVAEARFISAHGFFEKWEADVQLDPVKIENSSFKITIEATSINTRVTPRDNHLRSKDFFDVENYPQITLISKKIVRAGDKQYKVIADLTLHGVTKEVEVQLTEVFYENNRGRFKTEFQLNRKDFGINFDSKMNPIENIVKVQVDINVLDKEAMEKAQKPKTN